jgi:hypothetical protein
MIYILELAWKYVGKFIGFLLRWIEVGLCIRKTPYKTYSFKKNTALSEYYHNKLKFRQPYA